MTLAELLPSIGCATEPVLEDGLWPDGTRIAVRLVGRGGTPKPVTVVGRHCEAGDVLAEDVLLPHDVHRYL